MPAFKFLKLAVFAMLAVAALPLPALADDRRFDRNNGRIERQWDHSWDHNRDRHDRDPRPNRGRDGWHDRYSRADSYRQGYSDALRSNGYSYGNYNGYYVAPRNNVIVVDRPRPYDYPAYTSTNTTVYSYGNLTPLPPSQGYYYYSYR